MLSKKTLKTLDQQLAEKIISCAAVTGGCINQCYKITTAKQNYFIKVNAAANKTMFEAEQFALTQIAATNTVRVPRPLDLITTKENPMLVLEYIELQPASAKAYATLGTQLAKLHQQTADQFGFPIDNTIGSTKQNNTWTNTWLEFFAEQRLKFQLKLIKEKYKDSELDKLGISLLPKLEYFFQDLDIKPALIHGDLWTGNIAMDEQQQPVIFDPASYYAHSEMDLCMLNMFNPPPKDFWQAYFSIKPQAPGFAEREQLYQLYHYLNHYYIFGASYRSNCLSILQHLVYC